MTITCPSCGANYKVDPASLGEGRRVRCKRCRADWVAGPAAAPAPDAAFPRPIPPLDEAAAIDAIEMEEETGDPIEAVAIPRSAANSRPSLRGVGRASRRRSSFRVRPVALVAALSLSICAGLVAARAAVIGVAPSLASFYAAIGLPVNIRGLSILDVRSVEHIEEGVPLLLVTGAVENVSNQVIDVPRLRLAVTGSGKRELYAWTTVAARGKLEPGQSTLFRARLASPPAEGGGVEVRFLARKDLVAAAGR